MSANSSLPPDAEARLAMLDELHERTKGDDQDRGNQRRDAE